MASTTDDKIRLDLVLEDLVSDNANKAADAVATLKEGMSEASEKAKAYSAALRNLKGSSDEVKTAKAELKAKLEQEKSLLSAGQLALVRNSKATDALAARVKLAAAEVKKKAEAEKAAAKTAADLKEKIVAQNKAQADNRTSLAAVAGGWAAVAAAVGAATIALGRWAIASANTQRTLGLKREAAAGGSYNSMALGHQIDDLAKKVPTGKAALNELGNSMALGGIQGQTLVDTLNAVAQANAALGDGAGGKLQGLVDRGRLTQRFSANREDLVGTGLQTEDVAAALAENLHINFKEAQKALFEGRVKLADGAAAMRRAVEEKFGGINLRQMLDLNVIVTKLGETFDSLTADIDLDPILKGVKELASAFDVSTVNGQALKQMVTTFGNVLGDVFVGSVPSIKTFFDYMVNAGLRLTIGLTKTYLWLRKTFGGSEMLNGMVKSRTTLKAITIGVQMLAVAVGAVALVFAAMGASVLLAIAAWTKLTEWSESLGTSIRKFFLGTDWSSLGGNIVDGLIDGIKAGWARVTGVAHELAEKVKGAFTGKMEIHSPSRVFKGYGRNTVEGYVDGVDESAREADKAVQRMAPNAPGTAGAAGATSNSRSITVGSITIQVGQGAGPGAQEQAASIKEAFMKALEEMLVAQGAPA